MIELEYKKVGDDDAVDTVVWASFENEEQTKNIITAILLLLGPLLISCYVVDCIPLQIKKLFYLNIDFFSNFFIFYITNFTNYETFMQCKNHIDINV